MEFGIFRTFSARKRSLQQTEQDLYKLDKLDCRDAHVSEQLGDRPKSPASTHRRCRNS
jgi:hypothetical protein